MPTIAGREISDIGLGAMALSLSGRPSTERAESVILSSVEHGINWIDTADSYGLGDGIEGHGEQLVADVLERHHLRDKVLVATKGGHVWPSGQPRWVTDGRPAHLRAACERSLRRLRTDCIDLYQLHSIDPAVPASDQFGALAELADNGLIAAAGISNVTIEEFDLAASILGPKLAAAQNEGSIFEQPDPGIVVRCRELSITFIAHSAIGVATAAGHSTDHPRSRRSLDAMAPLLRWLRSRHFWLSFQVEQPSSEQPTRHDSASNRSRIGSASILGTSNGS